MNFSKQADLSEHSSKHSASKDFSHFLLFECLGIIFVIISSVILHFIYEWSHGATWAILFGAVNESTWEHIKIFTLPYVIWSFIELFCLDIPFKKFVTVKTATLYFLLLSIPVFFYTYSSILGTNITVVDILSGFLLTALTFILSYKMMTSQRDLGRFFKISLIFLALYYITFVFFTTSPPEIFLFQDPVTGAYGIPTHTT